MSRIQSYCIKLKETSLLHRKRY